MQATLPEKHCVKSPNRWRPALLIVIFLASIAIIVEGVYVSLPSIKAGFLHWASYFNLQWAHQESLIQVLVNFSLMSWLCFSALFFGGWLLRRSTRKLRGKDWALASEGKRKKFFPPVLLYLRISCYFLFFIFLFVVLQYPIQFIIFS